MYNYLACLEAGYHPCSRRDRGPYVQKEVQLMAKTSANYELMYIIDLDKGEEEIAAIVAKFKALIEANGTLNELEEMGKRQACVSHQRQIGRLLCFGKIPVGSRISR